MDCKHTALRCLNHYELIRKYQCVDCGAVMMCACDQAIGTVHLKHQLAYGTDFATKVRIAVTVGFQPSICRECRGLQPEPYPMSEIPRRTSKIRRYYWRELFFRELELFGAWAEANRVEAHASGPEIVTARKRCARKALEEIKERHEQSPKYAFREDSQAEIISRYRVEVVELDGAYLPPKEERGALIVDSGLPVSPEEYVRRHFARLGYQSMIVESVPFHVLFGTFMWLVIQDPTDPRVRIVGFGDRRAKVPGGEHDRILHTHLPEDFGSSGYSLRRADAIRAHFAEMINPDDLDSLFRYWTYHSEGLRQYLWAHGEDDIQTARRVLAVLPGDAICRVLQYLVESYWERYCGWPDLLVYGDEGFFFAEVKGSGDKLSEDQKHWIQGNAEILRLPFKLVKIRKARIVDTPGAVL